MQMIRENDNGRDLERMKALNTAECVAQIVLRVVPSFEIPSTVVEGGSNTWLDFIGVISCAHAPPSRHQWR
jgi:hypothetical protein